MSEKFNKLKKIESKIEDLCISRRLHTEAEHLKRIKCIKTLRLYIKLAVEDGTFMRIDTRVINDFKNHEIMKTTDLVKRLCIVFNSDLETSLDYYSKLAGNLNDNEHVSDNVNDQLNKEVSDQLNKEVNDKVDEEVNDKVDEQLKEGCNDQVNEQTNKQIDEQVNKDLNKDVNEQLNKDVNNETNEQHFSYNTEIYEWNKTEDEFNAFELRSKTKPTNIKIMIEFENKRGLFKLSHPLREIIENYTETKPNVITGLWKYIHKNALIKPGEIEIRADDKLKRLCGKDKFLFTDIPEIITEHLCPLDNLVIDVPLKSFYKDIIDIPIEVDDLYHLPRVHSKDVYNYEKKIEMLLEFKKRLKDKKDVLDNFSSNPIEFINRWLCLDSTDYYTKTHFALEKSVQELLYEMIQKLPY